MPETGNLEVPRAEPQLRRGLARGLTGVSLGAIVLAFAPLLWQHAIQLWIRPYYQFFPFALAGAAWLAVSRWRGLGPLHAGRAGTAFAALAAGWAVLAAAAALSSSWLAAAGLLPTLAALAYACGGPPLLKRMLPALVLLAVLVPPPLELDRQLVLLLQRLATRGGSRVLDLFGVFHVLSGNVVEVSGQRLLVEEACSGINSLFVVLACTLFFVFQARRPLVWSALLLAASVAWVLLANMARVVALIVLKVRYGHDLTTGWRHEAFGFLLFALVLLMIWSTDKLLRFFLSPSPPPGRRPSYARPEAAAEGPLPPPTRLDPSGSWLGGWLLPAAFALLVAFQWESYGFAGMEGGREPLADMGGLSADTLPQRWGTWEREAFSTETRNPGSYFGEVSKVWTFARARGMAAVSLDYPFPGWHDLTRCYTSQGWVVDVQQIHPGEGDEAGCVEVTMTKPAYRVGYLLFAQYDGSGRPLPPRPGGPALALYRHSTTLERWQQRLRGESPHAEAERPPVYQAQLFVETYTPLTAAEQAEVRDFFRQALPRVTAPLARD